MDNTQQQTKLPSTWIGIFIVLLMLIPLSLFGYTFLYNALHTPVTNTANGLPQIQVTDLSPEVPASEKTVVLIQHSDSSQEKVIMKTNLVSGYIQTLPEGEKALSQTSDTQ